MENQSWETDIAALLNELSATQDDLFDLLALKRRMLVDSDIEGIQGLEPRERELISRLEACHAQRGELLSRAAQQHLPGDSIRSLTRSLPAATRGELEKRVNDAGHR